ncbi:MAG: MscS family rane protein [Methanolobus sp.]|nr:MscS family rane protein [Methanolobus sp.]
MVTEPPNGKKNGKTLNEFTGRLKHTFLNRTILMFVFLSLVMASIVFANQRSLINIPQPIMEYVELIITILVSYTLTSVVARLTVNRIVNFLGDTFEPEQKILLTKAYIGLLYSIATAFVFVQLGITIQNIAIFFGLIATGFAFAIRDVILSYIAWFILLTKKPFKIGDYISIEGVEGLVKHIGMFYVLLDDSPETYEDFFKVPNKIFLEKPIRNYGKNRFSNEFDLYLKKMPVNLDEVSPDLDGLLEKLSQEVSKAVSTRVTMMLDSDKEGMKIRIYYKSTYKDRDLIKDRVLRLMFREFHSISKQNKDDDDS